MKRGTPRHPKVYDLMERLGCDRPAALGYLELLWHFTAEMAPQGDVGKYSNKRIEAALDWTGRGRVAGRLIQALIDSRWLDINPSWRARKGSESGVDADLNGHQPTVVVEESQCNGYVRFKVHDWKEHSDESTKKKLIRSGLSFYEFTGEMARQWLDAVRTPSASVADNISLPLPEPEPEPEPTPLLDAAASELDSAIQLAAQNIYQRHPAHRRCSEATIRKKLVTIAKQIPKAERVARVQQIDINHAACCKSLDWTKENGQFAKSLENWLAPSMGRFDVEPAPPGRTPPLEMTPRRLTF